LKNKNDPQSLIDFGAYSIIRITQRKKVYSFLGQGQSITIFGLSALLGIQLMPRIRNWKDLKLFRPSKEEVYEHILGSN
jgi:TnpA family transposase